MRISRIVSGNTFRFSAGVIDFMILILTTPYLSILFIFHHFKVTVKGTFLWNANHCCCCIVLDPPFVYNHLCYMGMNTTGCICRPVTFSDQRAVVLGAGNTGMPLQVPLAQ